MWPASANRVSEMYLSTSAGKQLLSRPFFRFYLIYVGTKTGTGVLLTKLSARAKLYIVFTVLLVLTSLFSGGSVTRWVQAWKGRPRSACKNCITLPAHSRPATLGCKRCCNEAPHSLSSTAICLHSVHGGAKGNSMHGSLSSSSLNPQRLWGHSCS